MSKSLYLIIFLLACLNTSATTTLDTLATDSLSSCIVDENQEALPFAIIFITNQDGKIVNNITADQNGCFKIAKKDLQAYTATARFTGYQFQELTLPLPSIIQLQPDANTLQEVVVKGKRSVYIVSKGVYEIDVAQSGLQNVPEVGDILAFLPGMMPVGNGMVVPLYGGIPVYVLNGVEQKNFERIKALRPEHIKSVSVNYYPSAKYSSQYGCVISVTTNRPLKDYFSAQARHFSYLFGRKYADEEVLNLTVAKKKWENYFSYTFSLSQSKNKATNQFDILDAQGETMRSAVSFNRRTPKSTGHYLKESFTYTPNEKWRITFQGDLSATREKPITAGEEEYREEGQPTILSSTHQDTKSKTLPANADVKIDYQIDDKSQLSVTGGYLYAKSKSDAEKLTNDVERSWINGENKYNAFSAKVEYDYTATNGLSINTGFQGSFIRNKGYSNYIYAAQAAPLYMTTSDYQDDDYSLYAGVNKVWGKFFLSTSVRGCLVRSKYVETDASEVTHSYFKLVPRINMQWDITPKWKLLGAVLANNYKPSFRDLLPLTHYLNPYFYQQGNPEIKSTDTYTLSFGAMWQNRFLLQARFCHTRNSALWTPHESTELNGAIVNSPVNFDYNYWAFAVGYSKKLGIYRLSYDADLQYTPTKISYLGGHAPRNPKITLSMLNQFDITPKTLLSINFAYTSKNGYVGVVEAEKFNLSCWVRQCFFKDNRMWVELQVLDLLHKANSKKSVMMNNIKTVSIPDMDSRYVVLTLVYTFNGFKDTFRRVNANAENQGRLDLK